MGAACHGCATRRGDRARDVDVARRIEHDGSARALRAAARVDRRGLQDCPAVALFCVTATLPAVPPAPVPIALPVRAVSAPVVTLPV